MEVNREGSGLDQEQMAGRFTLTRYILYLLPVIGFIGTVEGISKALMNISKVLPMVKNLDGFLTNLTSVTAALQIAFDSTLLALFLSAALMLVQTLVFRRSEDLLARVDRWVVEHVLPQRRHRRSPGGPAGRGHRPATRRAGQQAGAGARAGGCDRCTSRPRSSARACRVPIAQFATEVERLPDASTRSSRGPTPSAGSAPTSRRSGRRASRSARASPASRGSRRCSAQMAEPGRSARRDQARAGPHRPAIESLAGSWSAAYERSSRATQEQLARSLTSLKDALELLNVSMEQGNALYRNIVKKLFDERTETGPHRAESIRVA